MKPFGQFLRSAALAGGLLAGSGLRAAAAKWEAVDPAQLAETAPRLDPDAPAEVIFEKLAIDDSDYPQDRRVRTYIRYKIFDPEKAVGITRVTQASASVDGQEVLGDVSLHARLILPDGTIREFGNESIQERPLVRNGPDQGWAQRLFGSEGLESTEKFLAVGGIQPGSVLEFQTARTEHPQALAPGRYTLQRDIPIRRLEVTQRICPADEDFYFHPFVLNRHLAEVHVDPKGHVLTLAAHDLPALVTEPFTGSSANYALTYLFSYSARNTTILTQHSSDDSIHVDAKSGPWAGYATEVYLFEKDGSVADGRIKRLAAELTAGAPTGLEKARRIHQYVEDLHQRFLQTPRKAIVSLKSEDYVQSLEQVIDFPRYPDTRILPQNFHWLSIALDRAAGLQAQTVLLPNRATALFNTRLVAEMFLPTYGVRVLVDGKWQFDDPISATRIPFGMLPWQAAGQSGLLVQPNKQEFVEVPLTPADQSVIANAGNFQLDAKGALTGVCRRTYTGQSALAIRPRFRRANAQREQGIMRRLLAAEFKPALIKVTDLAGADDANAPLVVTYEMKYRDFAVLTADRIIFRPSVFHAAATTPFAADTRHYALEFPYPWEETDQINLQLPAGYRLESMTAPPSYPGDSLSYRSEITIESGAGLLHLRRDFMSKVLLAPASAYGPLKAWYDNVATNDQHELVLIKAATGAAVPPAP